MTHWPYLATRESSYGRGSNRRWYPFCALKFKELHWYLRDRTCGLLILDSLTSDNLREFHDGVTLRKSVPHHLLKGFGIFPRVF